MERITLTAQRREIGKGPAHRMRVAGTVPAVLYGKSTEPMHIAVNSIEIERETKKAAGSTMLIDLDVDGRKITTLVRDYQADPFKRVITHVDFQAVGLDEKVYVEVPIRLVGMPHGVKEGGILEQLRRSIDVMCTVSMIPSHIDVDVTELDIGDNIQAGELNLGEGVEYAHAANYAIAAVVPPTKEVTTTAVAAAPAEGEAAAAPVEGAAPAAEAKPAEGAAEKKKKEE